MILGCFDHAFLINADHEKARFASASHQLKLAGIAAERFPAVILNTDSNRQRAAEVGCVLSHCGVIQLAKQRGYKSVLIVEDDVVFRDEFQLEWPAIAEQVRKLSYDLFYFYDWQNPAQSAAKRKLTRISGTLCTHAYSVSRRYFDNYLGRARQLAAHGAIDQLLKTASAEKWGVVPNLAGQEAGCSTIYGGAKPRRWSALDG